MKLLSTRVPSDPPKKSPKKYTIEITEGEADLLFGLLLQAEPYSDTCEAPTPPPGASPMKYVLRLRKVFQKELGLQAKNSDAYMLAEGLVLLHPYADL